MSTDDQATEPTPTEPPASEATEATDATESSEPDQTAGGEAARYRKQLRAAEKERDDLAVQLEVMRRAEVTRLATTGEGPRLHAAADVFGDSFDMAELLDDAGAVDAAKVSAAIEHHTDGRAHLRADLLRPPKPDPSQGGNGGGLSTLSTGEGWAAALRGG